jgi:hypothetical protein
MVVFKVLSGLFDVSGHGSVCLQGFFFQSLKVMAFLGQNWFILSYFSSERGLSSGTGSSELASGTSTSELVYTQALQLLSWF